jgi:hypothetical protein
MQLVDDTSFGVMIITNYLGVIQKANETVVVQLSSVFPKKQHAQQPDHMPHCI